MTICKLDNKFFQTKTEQFDFVSPQIEPLKIFTDLKDSMIALKEFGLSANQIGYNYSVFVMSDWKNPDGILGFFNPVIINKFGDYLRHTESTPSLKNIKVEVKRHEQIRFRATNYNNITETQIFKGVSSRIFQHHFSILNGLTILDEVSKLRKDRAIKKAKS